MIFTISLASYFFLWSIFLSVIISFQPEEIPIAFFVVLSLPAMNSLKFYLIQNFFCFAFDLESFFEQRNLDWHFFVVCFRNFYMLISCLFIFVVSDEKLVFIWIIVLSHMMFFLAAFNILSLSLLFNNLAMICLRVGFLSFLNL